METAALNVLIPTKGVLSIRQGSIVKAELIAFNVLTPLLVESSLTSIEMVLKNHNESSWSPCFLSGKY